MTIGELRSECALLQASLDILAEHLRQEDEINALHKIEYARDLALEAYNLLGGKQPGIGENTNAVYTRDGEAMP